MTEPTQSPSTFACPHCGALYEVTVVRLRLEEKEAANCHCCGRVMIEWKTANPPSFRLIKSPEGG